MHSLDKPKRTFKRDDLKPVVALPPADDGSRSSWPAAPAVPFFYTERPAGGYDTKIVPYVDKDGVRQHREELRHPERLEPVRCESPKLATPKPEHSSLKLPDDPRAARGKMSTRPYTIIRREVLGIVCPPASPVPESKSSRLNRERAAEAFAKQKPETVEERDAREDRERQARIARGLRHPEPPTKAQRLSALRTLLELATTDEAEAKLLARIAEIEAQP